MEELCKQLSTLSVEESREIFLSKVKAFDKKIKQETEETIKAASAHSVNGNSNEHEEEWSHDELALLTKAVNLFPPGTMHR